jgi:hypothetical protein
LEYRHHFEGLAMMRCGDGYATAKAAAGSSSAGAAKCADRRRAAPIGNNSPRLLTTHWRARGAPPFVNHRNVARVMQHGTYADSAGRKATLPDGPAWFEKPRHAFSVANGRTKHSCQAFPKNTKPSVVAEAGNRHVTTLDRHLPGSISFWE